MPLIKVLENRPAFGTQSTGDYKFGFYIFNQATVILLSPYRQAVSVNSNNSETSNLTFISKFLFLALSQQLSCTAVSKCADNLYQFAGQFL